MTSRKKTDPLLMSAPPSCKFPRFLFRVAIALFGIFVFSMAAIGYAETLQFVFKIQETTQAAAVAMLSVVGTMVIGAFLTACWHWE